MGSIFLWILLLIIIIYITNSKIYEGYTEYESVDYPDNDIKYYSTVTNNDCAYYCDTSTIPCVGYVTDFVAGSGPGNCWTKSKMDNAVSDIEKVSQKK